VDQAEELYQRAAKQYPNHVPTLVSYAMYLLEVTKRYQLARLYLEEKVLRIEPDNADAIAVMAWLTFKLDPDHSKTEQWLNRLTKRPQQCEALWRYGNLLQHLNKDHMNAAAMYLLAIEADPENPNALGAYGMLLTNQFQDYDVAEGFFRRALDADESNGEVLHGFGVMLHDVGKHDEAEKYFRRAVQSQPDHPVYLYNLAILLHLVQSKFHDAADTYERCLQLEKGPFHTEELVLNCMSSYAVLLDDCLRDYDRAEEMYLKVLQIQPGDTRSLSNYARLLQNVRHDYDQAEQYYRRALEADPNNPLTLYNFAVLLHTVKNDNASAAQYYKRSIENDPSNASPMANYAILLDTMGEADEAEKYYRLAIGVDRFNPLHCFNYSSFLKSTRGDHAKAAKFALIGQDLSKQSGRPEDMISTTDQSTAPTMQNGGMMMEPLH
jgi:tetratricopeptide (TPR) repeat protein